MFDSGYVTPWFYRGWMFLASENYRYVVRKMWTTKPDWYKYVDIAGSIAVMILEIVIIVSAYTMHSTAT